MQKLIFLLFVIILISCHSNLNNQKGDNENIPKRNSPLQFTMLSKNLKTNVEDYSTLNARFKVKNATSLKISSIEIISSIDYEFSGESTKRIEWRDDHFENQKGEMISIKNPLIPNEEFDYEYSNRFHWELFQRTPLNAYLVLNYNVVTVDGKFEDSIRYDIIDDWKSYQQKLGLR